MAEATKKLTLRYLGPAVRISPGQDPDTGEAEPYVLVGNEITLDERQVVLLEQEGHQFEGRQQAPGELLRGSMIGYQPTAAPRPGAPAAVPAPPDTAPPAGPATTFGGQLPPTPEQQHELAENYPEMKTEEPPEHRGRHKS